MDFREAYRERFQFLLPQKKIEYPLYRYRKDNSFLIDEITHEHVFLSPLADLNDPFDSSFALSFEEALQQTTTIEHYLLRCFFLRGEKWYSTIEDNLNPHFAQTVTLDDFSQKVASLIKAAGGHYPASAIANNIYKLTPPLEEKRNICGRVACFSETWDSIPMWSYYAESHTGVCLKYDFSLLNPNDFSHQTILEYLNKVWYSQNRPIDPDGTFSPFVKGLQWAHEQEWRLFKEWGEPYIKIPCLTEIYLGINYHYENWEKLLDAVRKLPRDIKIFKLISKADTYGFQKIKINY